MPLAAGVPARLMVSGAMHQRALASAPAIDLKNLSVDEACQVRREEHHRIRNVRFRAKPLHRDPLVCEVAGMLMGEMGR